MMPPGRQGVPFRYIGNPSLSVAISEVGSASSILVPAYLDTGSDRSLFDSRILRSLRIESEPVEVAAFRGGGGGRLIAEFYEVHLALLDHSDLSVTLPIAFADGIEDSTGNLLGLDLLIHFDFALSHFERLGHIVRR